VAEGTPVIWDYHHPARKLPLASHPALLMSIFFQRKEKKYPCPPVCPTAPNVAIVPMPKNPKIKTEKYQMFCESPKPRLRVKEP
jgi:hypothetical protein